MINKVGISPTFTSKVYVVYENESYRYNKDFYEKQSFINDLEQLKNNGNDDTVIIVPYAYAYDYAIMELQVSKEKNGKFYTQTSFVEATPHDVIRAYNYAKNDMVLVDNNNPIHDYLI